MVNMARRGDLLLPELFYRFDKAVTLPVEFRQVLGYNRDRSLFSPVSQFLICRADDGVSKKKPSPLGKASNARKTVLWTA